jgi:hypothetical protein
MDILSVIDELSMKVSERPDVIVEGRGVTVERGASEICVSATDEPVVQSAEAGSVDFPFKVVKGEDPGSVVVMGYNEDEYRLFKNMVTLGLNSLEVPETRLSGITEGVWIYLSVSYSASSYAAEIKSAGSLPAQSESEYVVPVAYVECQDAAIVAIHQMQYGPVQAGGRIF